MSTAFYEEMQKVASDVLSEFKQGAIVYVKTVPGNGPADNPGEPTTVRTTLDAVSKGVSFKFVSDGLALSTDLTVTAAVVDGLTPDARDFIEIDGVSHKIVQDVSVPGAGVRAVWKFIVRKA
jgi:hypothetical protein